MLKKGSHTANKVSGWGIFKQYFVVREKRQGKPVCGERKIHKPVHSISAFQNGRFVLPPQITIRGRFHVQDGYKRCLLFSSTVSVIKNYVRFSWSENLYESLCLCFGLRPAPRIFAKLLKTPMSVLSRINIRIVIFLDNMLIMGQTMEKILMSRDTVIFLLQHLGFALNLEKSILNPVLEIVFLGVTINSLKVYLS